MTFSENLKRQRKQKNVLQKELAAYLQCSIGTVSNYENGVHYPDLDMLCKLADFYDVTVDALLGREEKAQQKRAPERLERTAEHFYSFTDFVQLMETLSANARAHLLYELRLYECLCKREHDDPTM